MRKFFDYLDKIICVVLFVMLCVMLVVGSMQIIWRYVLRNSLSWSEELLRFMYVWATMIGVPLGIRRKSFAAIETLLDFVESKSEAGKMILHTIAFAVQIMVFGIFVVYGIKFVQATTLQTAPALQWKMSNIYLAFPIGGALSLLFTLESMVDYYLGRKKAKEEVPASGNAPDTAKEVSET